MGGARRLTVVLALVALAPATSPGAGAAQEVPPPAGPPDTLAADTLPADTLDALPGDTTARPAPVLRLPPRVAVSATIGTLGFTDLQTQPVMATLLGEEGVPPDSAVLERRLAVEDGLQFGVAALVSLTPAWALRAGASWGRGRLAGGDAGDDPIEGAARGLAPAASDRVDVFAIEAALRFRVASSRRAQPWAELGAGAVRLTAEDPSFPGAAALDGAVSLAALAGVGAVVPIRGPISGVVRATAQVFRTPAVTAPADAPVAANDTLRVRFLAPGGRAVADPGRELLRALRLEVGLSVGLGAARPRAVRADRPSGSPP